VADPRQTGVLDTALINAHEQHHRDLINNTVYGYVLRRLRELDTAPPSIESRRNRLVTSLAAKIWTCAEGSATAMESLMAVTPGSGTTLAALEASLTPDYSEALAIFQPIREYAIPFPPPFDMLARLSPERRGRMCRRLVHLPRTESTRGVLGARGSDR
jgi:hypothetical protein